MKDSIFGRRGVLLGGAAAIAAPARDTAAAIDTTAQRRFNIPAQPLGDARSTAVTGLQTAPDALRRLLAGTGLAARFTDPATVIVARATRMRWSSHCSFCSC